MKVPGIARSDFLADAVDTDTLLTMHNQHVPAIMK
jgi:hypothetical protein